MKEKDLNRFPINLFDTDTSGERETDEDLFVEAIEDRGGDRSDDHEESVFGIFKDLQVLPPPHDVRDGQINLFDLLKNGVGNSDVNMAVVLGKVLRFLLRYRTEEVIRLTWEHVHDRLHNFLFAPSGKWPESRTKWVREVEEKCPDAEDLEKRNSECVRRLSFFALSAVKPSLKKVTPERYLVVEQVEEYLKILKDRGDLGRWILLGKKRNGPQATASEKNLPDAPIPDHISPENAPNSKTTSSLSKTAPTGNAQVSDPVSEGKSMGVKGYMWYLKEWELPDLDPKDQAKQLSNRLPKMTREEVEGALEQIPVRQLNVTKEVERQERIERGEISRVKPVFDYAKYLPNRILTMLNLYSAPLHSSQVKELVLSCLTRQLDAEAETEAVSSLPSVPDREGGQNAPRVLRDMSLDGESPLTPEEMLIELEEGARLGSLAERREKKLKERMEQPGMNQRRKQLLAIFAEEPECWRNQTALADRIGCSRNTIRTDLKFLGDRIGFQFLKDYED